MHNAQSTLKSCLNSVFSSYNNDFEVIIVDDKSTDMSLSIAEKYPCTLIALEENKGAAFARNTGTKHARGDTLVFIDADVIIKQNTLDTIENNFKEEQDTTAITGFLSKECLHKDFFTQYKNLYMHYIFKRCPRYVDFLYGSIIAIKKSYFLRFDERFKITDDTELGLRYRKLNKKIVLNPELEVAHLKKYNLMSIIKNDFFVPFWWFRSFLLHNGIKDILRKKRFSHARAVQIISIFISYLLIICLFFLDRYQLRIIFFSLLLLFFLLNYRFFVFLFQQKGLAFLIKSIIFTYLDMLIMGSGILIGFLHSKIIKRVKCNDSH